jgi:hypothetical protein
VGSFFFNLSGAADANSVTTVPSSFPRPNIRIRLTRERTAPRFMPLTKNGSARLRLMLLMEGDVNTESVVPYPIGKEARSGSVA